ncbi:MAG: hypothetical protein K9I68_08625 [Bacteroidales bacterium]|nr:hypothetical protein [Bacteroidales bacterium]MCF8336823.1 hypothetical protein [Bacteroidales bacterium]
MQNKETVTLNRDFIEQITKVIASLNIRPSFYERPFLSIDVEREVRLRGYFYAVAICHQTHNLKSEQKQLFGWDYLEEGFVRMMRQNPDWWKPKNLYRLRIHEIADRLAHWFSDKNDRSHSTLNRLEERSHLMKDVGKFVWENYDGSFEALFDRAGERLCNEGKGIYEVMPAMEAFSDPLQKKTTFLMKLLQDAGILKLRDAENIIPIMDYHMMRVLLRTGAVEVKDGQLRDQLIQKQPLDSDREIRNTCATAMQKIGLQSGHGILEMNDFFWTLGRSCCAETTLCRDRVCAKNPCTFEKVVNINDHSRCVFEDICKGAVDENYRKLWQPEVKTHFY